MRICIVAENHPKVLMGGAEYQTHLLAAELSGRPAVDVIYLARRVPVGEAAADVPYPVRRIGSDAGIRYRATFFDRSELSAALRELRPDVVYQRMRQSYTAVCADYARENAIPFFFHVASDIDLDTRFVRFGINGNLPFDLIEGWHGRRGIERASHIIVQSSRQAHMLRERFRREPMVLVRNFQPLPEALPAKQELPLRVLWVGNFKRVKRPELFVDLAQAFVHRGDIQFQMIGRPDGHRSDPVIKKIEELPNLQYLGELPVHEVNAHLAAAHVLVNTSSFEGFPNTFIQAWAQGAVVCSLVVDPDGSMESTDIGYCSGTMERLVAIIEELAGSPAKRRFIAARAFSFVHANHSLAKGAELAQLMLDAAAQSKRRSSALSSS